MTTEFLYPMIYTGPKEKKSIDVPGRREQLTFQKGPLSEEGEQLEGLAYADVTEKEGRYVVKRFPGLFAWPEGTKLGPQVVTREEYDNLAERVLVLEETLAKALTELERAAAAKKADTRPQAAPAAAPPPTKQEPQVPAAELPEDLPGREHLVAAGILKLEAVLALSREELVALPGIGKATADRIVAALTPAAPPAPKQEG